MFEEGYNAVCNAGKNKLHLLESNPIGYVASSFMAGGYIALGTMLMGVVGGYFSAGNSAGTKLACGLVFSIGLCLVIMAGAELFTGNNFVMAASSLKGAVPWSKTIKVWTVCFLGNLLGSAVFGSVFVLTGLMDGAEVGGFLQNAAASKVVGEPLNLFAKAILCNVCVSVGVWCSIKMKTESGKLIMAFVAVVPFVTCGFEHCVANMTFFTIGLLAPGEAVISLTGILYNMVIVTAGNIVGGALFMALPYYLISKEK